MRIAFMVHDYHRNGGHARYVAELATRFSNEHEVHVFSNTFEEESGHRIKHHYVPALRANALLTILTYVLPATWKVRRAGPFDIIHAQGFCGLTQNVMTVHISQTGWFRAVDQSGQSQSIRKSIFRWIAKRLESFAFKPKAAQAFIAVSSKLRDELRELHRLDGNVEVIHHGIDVDAFHPLNTTRFRGLVRHELGLDEAVPLGLYVGDWQKAGAVLLASLRQTSELKLLVVSKTHRELIERQIAEAGLSDRVLLAPPTRRIQRYYAAADLFVFPSFYDTFAMVVAEAMATGLPVIVSRQTGACEWIDHGRNGLIVESATDAKSWSLAMADLSDKPELRRTIGEAARATCLDHSWDRVAAETMRVYRKVVGL